MSFQQEINLFLRGKSILELIQYFDTEFDIPFQQGQCIGLLEMLEAYKLNGLDNIEKLAEYVGAWWCRIVSADVLYDILGGLEAIRASENDASKIYQEILNKTFNSEQPNERMQMIAYIAARWHDGAAKIHYRCNDHTEARILFQKAKEIAEHAHLWYCLPDIQSNCLRVEYEELRAVGNAIDLKTKYQELLDQYRDSLEQKLSTARQYQNLNAAESAPKHYYQEREFLRGLASIFHNLSVELKKKQKTLNASQKESEQSEDICRVLGDRYRLAQALNHQAQLALRRKEYDLDLLFIENIEALPLEARSLIIVAKIDNSHHVRIFNSTGNIILDRGNDGLLFNDELVQQIDTVLRERVIDIQEKPKLIREIICSLGDPKQKEIQDDQLTLKRRELQKARRDFTEVAGLPWRRGQLIAEQNLAKIDAEEGLYNNALTRITSLLDQVQEINQHLGGNLGFDSDFHYFTVNALKEILRKAINTEGISPNELEQYQIRLNEEQRQMVRSIRKVVKITTYKTAFSKRFYPIYLELIADHLQQEFDDSSNLSTAQKTEFEELAFSLIEEASSRELLDLLQTKTLATDAILPNPISPASFSDQAATGKVPESSRGRRSSIRNIESQTSDDEEKVLSLLNERRRQYEDYSLKQPINTSESNPDIAYEVRMFTANHPKLVIVRYFFCGTGNQRQLAAYVFRDGAMCIKRIDWQRVEAELLSLWEDTWGSKEAIISIQVKKLSELISSLLIEPLWDSITGGNTLDEHHHLVLIPSEELFKLPLHIACVPGKKIPLTAYVPLSFSVSATAYITRGRHLQRRQRVEKDDDLCVLIQPDETISGKEIVGLNWPSEAFHIAGQRPEGLEVEPRHHGQANRQGMSGLIKQKPEFFIYAGHGLYKEAFKSVGPVLELDGDCLTQFDIAMGVRLPRNKLTVLGACVSGQGTNLGGGEVAGFIRSFIAAGCGALGVTLWPVLDDNIAETIRHLLTAAQSSSDSGQPFDVVQESYRYYQAKCKKLIDLADQVEACPLALYL